MLRQTRTADKRLVFGCACAALLCLFLGGSLPQAAPAAPQDSASAAKQRKSQNLRWTPPDPDAHLALSASPPCVLADVLRQAAAQAEQMGASLADYTATETVEYEGLEGSDIGVATGHDTATFDYMAVVVRHGEYWSVQEIRTPVKGSHALRPEAEDTGLPAMALIFLPAFQGDYDMQCEGATQWNGQSAWVIHFRQRRHAHNHALVYRDAQGTYPTSLQGRAWISADTGVVLHLETSLLEPVPAMHVLNSWLSIVYAPVQFHTQNVKMWLPQTADAYSEYDHYRIIVHQSFADFKIFGVSSRQQIKPPAQPH